MRVRRSFSRWQPEPVALTHDVKHDRPRRPRARTHRTRLATHQEQARYSTDYPSICRPNNVRGTLISTATGGSMLKGILTVILLLVLEVSADIAQPLTQTPTWFAESDQAGTWFGVSVATAGDVNGDGYDDVIVGAPNVDNQGLALVYLGSPAGLGSMAAWSARGGQAFAQFGISVAAAGDVNGDEYGDVIVGARSFDNGQIDEGAAFVYLGSAQGLGLNPSWMAESNQASSWFGESVASAGDVNNDGYSDVIVGAYRYDNGQTDEGLAMVYLGSASGLQTTVAWRAEGNQGPGTAGTGANFGYSVAAAGDVNGDGYADVIIGAPGFDNGELDEGAAFVYLGSASGLSNTVAWMAQSNDIGRRMGESVASAGDVNGDGYSDVAAGISYYFTQRGKVHVFHGAASGLSLLPDRVLGFPLTPCSQSDFLMYFGNSVASAGDVNGDGYDDLVVGAPLMDNCEDDEGLAFLYLGSGAGLVSSPAWLGEFNQANSFFGYSVASAGDLRGDGTDDVIIGAYQYDNGQTDEGRAFVYESVCGISAGQGPYGQLLFPPLCTRDASALSADVYDSTALTMIRSERDRFFLSASGGVTSGVVLGDIFAPLIVDDAVHINGTGSGLGPYTFQSDVPPFRLGVPIESNLMPLPPHDVTSVIPLGPSTVLFELLDTQRAIYGHTAVYLIQDCGIWLSGRAPTVINWITHDDEIASVPPEFDARYGLLSELKEDRNFSRAMCLGVFTDTPASDSVPDPTAGDGYYYLVRGVSSCTAQGYGDSSLIPDPRDALDALPICP